MAPRIANLAEWRAHVLGRLRREVTATQDPQLKALLAELAIPRRRGAGRRHHLPGAEESSSRCACAPGRRADLHVIVSTFGTPVDITVQELSIEAFFPADEATAGLLRAALSRGQESKPSPSRSSVRSQRPRRPSRAVGGGQPVAG